MRTTRLASVWMFMVIVAWVMTGCSASATAAPTKLPSSTPTIPATSTATARPTATLWPTATPDVAATQEIEVAMGNVQKYAAQGYLPSTHGQLFPLNDFSKSLAEKNYLDVGPAGYDQKISNFAVWGDLKGESAGPVDFPEYSGCGFVVRVQDNNDAYYALITNNAVLVESCLASDRGYCHNVGKTKGNGRLGLANPYPVHFEFIVNDIHAYALVDGQFSAEYTLFTDKLTDPG